jgi:tRNA (cytidine32/uridine32-2'-O)-methyltransferase
VDQLSQIKIVLVEPTHPGNIGSVARAMKTMGLSRLVLVNPKKFPHYEASKLAAGAESVLEQAEVVQTLSEAIDECTLVVGTSVRDREVTWPTRDPRAAAQAIIQHTAVPTQQAAILFGRESSGLTNAELDQCQFQIRIPANPEYSSLNLASAVQLINYELRMQAIAQTDGLEPLSEQPVTNVAARQRPATKAEREGHLEHLQNTLVALDFVKVNPPTVLMRKLTRLYNKADLTVEEIQILRGILASVDQHLTRS